MRYGIISCVHANLPALEAVFRDSDQQRCDAVLCLGDIVGYSDRPKECVQIVRTRCTACVKGNHDELCAASGSLEKFNPIAAEVIGRTRAELSPADREWLGCLPYQIEVDDFTLVHASLDTPESWPYIFDRLAAQKHFKHQSSVLCFIGHTHVPMVFQLHHGEVLADRDCVKFTLQKGTKYLVNGGSVGRPQGGVFKAAYAIYDNSTRTVELRRVDYPAPPSGGHGTGITAWGGPGPTRTLRAQNKSPDGGQGTSI